MKRNRTSVNSFQPDTKPEGIVAEEKGDHLLLKSCGIQGGKGISIVE
jgi:hypothetical protein